MLYYLYVYSIVLMAMCDASYKFTYVDVGTPGRWSDGGTFDVSTLSAAMEAKELNVPPNKLLPGTSLLHVHIDSCSCIYAKY